MISNPLAAALAKRNFHYGWVVVAVTFLTMLVTAAAVGAPGVLIVPLEKEFGWETKEIATAFSIRLLLFGLMGPFAAAFMNYFGVRKVVCVALVLITAGLFASLAMTEIWQLILLWGVVVGFGTGLTAMVLGATVAARWFTERRGLALGMLTASSATGQLAFMPLMASLSENYGWRTAIMLICSLLIVAVVAVFFLMRDRPADVGLPAYGDKKVIPTPPVTGGLITLITMPLIALKDALTQQYLLGAVCHLLCLRGQHEWSCWNTFCCHVWRFRNGTDNGSKRSGNDGIL